MNGTTATRAPNGGDAYTDHNSGDDLRKGDLDQDPQDKALVLCADKKRQMAALDRTASD